MELCPRPHCFYFDFIPFYFFFKNYIRGPYILPNLQYPPHPHVLIRKPWKNLFHHHIMTQPPPPPRHSTPLRPKAPPEHHHKNPPNHPQEEENTTKSQFIAVYEREVGGNGYPKYASRRRNLGSGSEPSQLPRWRLGPTM